MDKTFFTMQALKARSLYLIKLSAFSASLWLKCFLLLTPVADAKQIGPEEDYCREINDPHAGSEFVLRSGRFQSPCKIKRGGTPEAPLTIQAADPANPPVIDYQGTASNVFEIYADHIVIRGLQFSRTKTDIDAIRVISGNDITIEDCHFHNIGGIAVAATHSSVRGFTVRRNVITNSLATAMYFGCHNGSDCVITDLLVQDNHIQEVTAPDPSIGYAIQVKLNSTAIIRGNRIVNTKGPGIMAYGSQQLSNPSLIERNMVSGSRNSSGILIGGGPAIVRNNIAVYNGEGGIGLQDYASRGLLRNIIIVHNTMYGNERGGIFISGEKLTEVEIVNNAGVMARSLSIRSLGASRVYAAGNIDCTTARCFRDPEKLDFAPAQGSPLLGASVPLKKSMPTEDFFGRPRNGRPAVGAVENSRGRGPEK
jgi:hypothetical protein